MTTPTVGNNVQQWLEVIHKMATMNKQLDGHLTIMAFTTGWKAKFGTPELSEAGRAELWQMATWPTLEKALEIVYQDTLSEIEYWNEDERLHDQPVSSDAQAIEQIKAKAFGDVATTDAGDDLPPELTLTLEQCAYCGTPTNAPNYAYHVCVSGGQSEPPELDFEQLASHASAWPWPIRDALRRFVGMAMTNAGIADKAKHLAVQDQLAWLFGEET